MLSERAFVNASPSAHSALVESCRAQQLPLSFGVFLGPFLGVGTAFRAWWGLDFPGRAPALCLASSAAPQGELEELSELALSPWQSFLEHPARGWHQLCPWHGSGAAGEEQSPAGAQLEFPPWLGCDSVGTPGKMELRKQMSSAGEGCARSFRKQLF